MAGSQEILQSFLIQIGYKTDAISLKKFEDSLGKTGKSVFGVGTAVAGVVASIDAAATAFAYSMRKMYFQSELSGSTVKNLEGIKFAGEQVGVSGDAMAQAVHNMAQSIRLNPGIQQLLQSFGVRVTGRDMSDVVLDTVSALNKMPEWQAAKYGSMFGLDPDTLHQLRKHMDEVYKARREMAAIYKEMGFDPDIKKNKDAINELTHSLDILGKKFEILGEKILVNFVGPLSRGTKLISDTIDLISNYSSKEEGADKKTDAIKNKVISDAKSVGSDIGEAIDFLFKKSTYGYGEKFVSGAVGAGQKMGEAGSELAKGIGYVFKSALDKSPITPADSTRLGATPGVVGSAPVTIIQKTDINVTGTDSASTAKAVIHEQERVNKKYSTDVSQSLRNLKGM